MNCHSIASIISLTNNNLGAYLSKTMNEGPHNIFFCCYVVAAEFFIPMIDFAT